jgi:AAA domain/UvrD-like helicase C-terminal domain
MPHDQHFRIADTFTESLARLTGGEQKTVRTAALELQLNQAAPGVGLHRLDTAREKNFWCARLNGDLGLIVHKSPGSLLLCYADHHDKARDWAERRKLETHPKIGAAQLVEIREKVKGIHAPMHEQTEFVAAPKPAVESNPLFGGMPDDELLGLGIPTEWLGDVRNATRSSLPELIAHLPAEAAEALLELTTGGKPRVPQLSARTVNPFNHPDARRRFRVIANVEELQRALDFPREKWTIFLHPEQRRCVERDYAGPARVSGSAGTGKTIVAVHRAAHLARTHSDARILLTTFSDTLADGLRTKLRCLFSNEPRLAERIDVQSIDAIGLQLYRAHVGTATIVSDEVLRELMRKAAGVVEGHKFGIHFLITEWEEVVDAWQLESWEVYRDVARLGRETRRSEDRRPVLWTIFERVREGLRTRKLITRAELFTSLAAVIEKQKQAVFDFTVVDEAQDISVARLRLIAALGKGRADALFFAGDLGQRIFQQPFSWKALGVDIRGRSSTLRVNYRNAHEIRAQADRLLGSVLTDVDGNSDIRNDTVSVLNGSAPAIRSLRSRREESKAVGDWITERMKAGVLPQEMGILVRSAAQLDRARAAAKEAGVPFKVFEEQMEIINGHVSICAMPLAKGLEFRAVAVMACDDEILPLQERILAASDDADLKEVSERERRLFYVALTRARDHLLVTSVAPASKFLDDIGRV